MWAQVHKEDLGFETHFVAKEVLFLLPPFAARDPPVAWCVFSSSKKWEPRSCVSV